MHLESAVSCLDGGESLLRLVEIIVRVQELKPVRLSLFKLLETFCAYWGHQYLCDQKGLVNSHVAFVLPTLLHS